MTSPLSSFHTSTPKESSGARPKIISQNVRDRDLDDSFEDYVPLDKELDSMCLEDVEKEFQELTAQFNRCKQELDKSRAQETGVRVQSTENKRVSFDLPTQDASTLENRETELEKDALIQRIRELERSERELSAQLDSTLHVVTPTIIRHSLAPETPQINRATPTQVTPNVGRVTSVPETPQINQATSIQGTPQSDRATSRQFRFTPVDRSFANS